MKEYKIIIAQIKSFINVYKKRTAIAIIGILLSATSLVIIKNLSISLNKRVENDITAIGDRVISINARRPYVKGQTYNRKAVKSMKISDASELLNINNVIKTAAVAIGKSNVQFNSKLLSTDLIGTEETYFDIKKIIIESGREFNKQDRELKKRVAIIGSEVYKNLFNSINNALGKTIFINRVPFEVIGIMEEKGSNSLGQSLDNIIIIPVETYNNRVYNNSYINGISAQIRSWDVLEDVEKNITALLRYLHNIPNGVPDDFIISNPKDDMNFTLTMIKIAGILGTISSLIAFTIGTIGIFSLMLLIVSQRTVEIGIKRAIGATKKIIIIQFIAEATIIGTSGGIIGIIVGIILSIIIQITTSLPITISINGVFVGFIAGVLSGIIAGIYPAIKASRVTTIQALKL